MNDLGRLFIVLTPVTLWKTVHCQGAIMQLMRGDVVLQLKLSMNCMLFVFVPRTSSIGWINDWWATDV